MLGLDGVTFLKSDIDCAKTKQHLKVVVPYGMSIRNFSYQTPEDRRCAKVVHDYLFRLKCLELPDKEDYVATRRTGKVTGR